MSKTAFVAGLLALPALALSAAGATAASNCDKEGKEGEGCTLPKGADYQYSRSDNDEMIFRVGKRSSTLALRSSCAHQLGRRFKVQRRLKVGKTYKFEHTKVVQTPRGDAAPAVTTYTIKFSVTLKSAKEAVAKGSATFFQPALPPGGGYPEEDELRGDCSLKRTLKRTLD